MSLTDTKRVQGLLNYYDEISPALPIEERPALWQTVSKLIERVYKVSSANSKRVQDLRNYYTEISPTLPVEERPVLWKTVNKLIKGIYRVSNSNEFRILQELLPQRVKYNQNKDNIGRYKRS